MGAVEREARLHLKIRETVNNLWHVRIEEDLCRCTLYVMKVQPLMSNEMSYVGLPITIKGSLSQPWKNSIVQGQRHYILTQKIIY